MTKRSVLDSQEERNSPRQDCLFVLGQNVIFFLLKLKIFFFECNDVPFGGVAGRFVDGSGAVPALRASSGTGHSSREEPQELPRSPS